MFPRPAQSSGCVAVQSITAASIIRGPLPLTLYGTGTPRCSSPPLKWRPAPKLNHLTRSSSCGQHRSRAGPVPVQPNPKPTAKPSRYGGAADCLDRAYYQHDKPGAQRKRPGAVVCLRETLRSIDGWALMSRDKASLHGRRALGMAFILVIMTTNKRTHPGPGAGPRPWRRENPRALGSKW